MSLGDHGSLLPLFLLCFSLYHTLSDFFVKVLELLQIIGRRIMFVNSVPDLLSAFEVVSPTPYFVLEFKP